MTTATGVTPRTQKVEQLNGHELTVLTADEKKFYNDQKEAYQGTYAFTERSDLNDLDRLLVAELQVFRMTRWLSTGKDYANLALPESQIVALNRAMREANGLIAAVKGDLGMTRSARDAGADSVPAYLKELGRRAREFGIHREKQLDKALGLILQVRSQVHTFYRSNENERQKAGIPTEAVLVQWIRDEILPQYDEVDEYFRTHQQKLWVGTL